ncbi:uncharacterized protein LOC116345410 [Contarinia nasturtii]|uniref:uncharacterized protein LOC116345410 n=1 Tax=Contarinia nasturtii TaxID=265458 RepID=UPI0012D41E87|nr:uncharacterized protein LOC116345410 [Contarinia nasturtii]
MNRILAAIFFMGLAYAASHLASENALDSSVEDDSPFLDRYSVHRTLTTKQNKRVPPQTMRHTIARVLMFFTMNQKLMIYFHYSKSIPTNIASLYLKLSRW